MIDRVNEARGYPLAPGQVEQVLVDETTALSEWLQANGPYCVAERAHLEAGSRERAYWHYGYLTALRDVQAMLSRQRRR
jgi:hypothetical protein